MVERLGERMRERRKAIGKTLKDIADATNLSVGFISQIERNLTVPSLSSLATVANVLGVTVADLMGQRIQAAPDTYHDQRKPYRVESGGVFYERLSSVFRGSQLHSVKFTMPSGYKSETVSHAGEEMIFVLRGCIRYAVNEKRYVLEPGDSLHFDAKIPHSVESMPSELGFSEVIWTGTLDLFDGADSKPHESEPIELKGTEFFELTQSG